jgi:hypothetical protein
MTGTSTVGEAVRFNQAILDSFAGNIAVLDKEGTIIGVNRAWSLVTHQNGSEVRSTEVGANYLEVAQQKGDPYGPLAESAYLGIKSVLDGRLPEFFLEYSSTISAKKRWYLLHVTGLLETSFEAATVSHLEVTALKEAEIKRLETAEQFHELANYLHQAFWLKDAVEPPACRRRRHNG